MSNADVLKELAPTGTLRASINLGNIVLAQGTPDAPSGVTPELARELAWAVRANRVVVTSGSFGWWVVTALVGTVIRFAA